MNIHAIVFYNAVNLKPLNHKIYTEGVTRYERRFITEFIEFGKKEFLKKMNTEEDEFVISLMGGSFLIYITVLDGIGLAMLASKVPELNQTPHLVSKKLIYNYMIKGEIPNNRNDILCWFKHKEILSELDETKKVIKRTISKVIEKGEKIEELVEITELLSNQSKVFFKTSRKMNSCCFIFPRR